MNVLGYVFSAAHASSPWTVCKRPNQGLHYLDLLGFIGFVENKSYIKMLWICCTTCCTTKSLDVARGPTVRGCRKASKWFSCHVKGPARCSVGTVVLFLTV